MYYVSTRGNNEKKTASAAILSGIAGDGGLFVPEEIPQLGISLDDLSKMSYKETAFQVMKLFFDDFTKEELTECIDKAYGDNFDTPVIAPYAKKDDAYFIELFHGPTIAFKDMALQILPHLLTCSAKKNNCNDEIVILTATSGDTGKAAMAGFADVPGTGIIVFYPNGGVSKIQELQMVTQEGENVSVCAIDGNFDDAQTAVKNAFTDPILIEELARANKRFSSANSINIGRLVPQIVYYVYTYAKMLADGEIKAGDKVNVCVPTGNFGNILAAYYAKQMGLPVNKLICASNKNKILTDFFATGEYDCNRDFYLTSSPSMDILISSNLERLVFELCGRDGAKCASYMNELKSAGKYSITDEMKEKLGDFFGGFSTEEENFESIKSLYEKTGYVIDTHTGIAYSVYKNYVAKTGDTTPTVIASTASPYKFAGSVVSAIDSDYESKDAFGDIDVLEKISGVPVPSAVKKLKTAEIRHNLVTTREEIKNTIKAILEIGD